MQTCFRLDAVVSHLSDLPTVEAKRSCVDATLPAVRNEVGRLRTMARDHLAGCPHLGSIAPEDVAKAEAELAAVVARDRQAAGLCPATRPPNEFVDRLAEIGAAMVALEAMERELVGIRSVLGNEPNHTWAKAVLDCECGYLELTQRSDRPYRWTLTLPKLLALWRRFLKVGEDLSLSALCGVLVDKKGKPMDPDGVSANNPSTLPKLLVEAMCRAGFRDEDA